MAMSTREALEHSKDILAVTAAWNPGVAGVAVFSDRSVVELKNAQEVYEGLGREGFSGGNPSLVTLGHTVISRAGGFVLRNGVSRTFREEGEDSGIVVVVSLGLEAHFLSRKVARMLAEG